MWPGRAPRIKTFFYRGYHRYFLTVATCLRTPFFADPRNAEPLCAQIPSFFAVRQFEVLAYCVMPDHVHLLLEGISDDADLREAMRAWKQRTGYDWKQRSGGFLWQPGFHDHVMRDGEDVHLVVRYMLQNPVRAGLVKTARDYPWCGSLRYTLSELMECAGSWTPNWKRR